MRQRSLLDAKLLHFTQRNDGQPVAQPQPGKGAGTARSHWALLRLGHGHTVVVSQPRAADKLVHSHLLSSHKEPLLR